MGRERQCYCEREAETGAAAAASSRARDQFDVESRAWSGRLVVAQGLVLGVVEGQHQQRRQTPQLGVGVERGLPPPHIICHPP